jgi:hypothetical protein
VVSSRPRAPWFLAPWFLAPWFLAPWGCTTALLGMILTGL